MTESSYLKITAAGAFAGLIVDTSLYPIDTLKSRMQSGTSFLKAGGFNNVYRGITPILISSLPNGAIYLFTYERTRGFLGDRSSAYNQFIAGAAAELASCSFKVPFEVIKVRLQLGNQFKLSIKSEDIKFRNIPTLYAGFLSTLIRDVPFSIIQMPIWEQLKMFHCRKTGKRANQAQSAFYGAIGGAVAAFWTCPLDVVKTRIMLSPTQLPIHHAFAHIWRQEGLTGFFAGVVPRVTWVSLGGGIFFGAYEVALKVLGVNLS